MTDAIQTEIQKVLAQESLLYFEAFDETTARELGDLILKLADPLGPVIVDIRRGDDLVFFAAAPGTSPANADWARRKRNLANLLQRSTMFFDLENQLGKDVVDIMKLDRRDYAVNGGCFPIRVNGAGMIGTVTVSGLKSRDDHKLATDAIAQLTGVDLGDSAF